MDDREVLSGDLRDRNLRRAFGGRRKRGEERERKMAHSVSKLRTMGPVPGIDGVEGFQRGNAGPIHDSHQIQGSVGKSPGAVGEADQGKHRTRGPNFGIRRAGGFERGERKNDVADRAGTD